MQRPALHWWVLVVGGLALNAYIAFSTVPFPALSDSGFALSTELTAVRFVLRLVFVAAVMAHVCEGAYAHCLARKHDPDNTLQWTAQTTILGYPSLRLLLRMAEKKST